MQWSACRPSRTAWQREETASTPRATDPEDVPRADASFLPARSRMFRTWMSRSLQVRTPQWWWPLQLHRQEGRRLGQAWVRNRKRGRRARINWHAGPQRFIPRRLPPAEGHQRFPPQWFDVADLCQTCKEANSAVDRIAVRRPRDERTHSFRGARVLSLRSLFEALSAPRGDRCESRTRRATYPESRKSRHEARAHRRRFAAA